MQSTSQGASNAPSQFIKCETDGEVAILSMRRGKANPLNSQMVDELYNAFVEADYNDGVRAVVLASDLPNFFSAGFDVIEVFRFDRVSMTEFFGRFIDLYELIVHFKKPVVAAVNGHAYAGGAVLALSCDARVLSDGNFGFALNEVNLGMVLPPGMIRMAVRAVGISAGRDMVMFGASLNPRQALETRLAAELASPDDVLGRAVAMARELGSKPPAAFAAVKALFLKAASEPAGGDREGLDQFVEQWFSPECTAKRESMIESFSARRNS